jgi:iron complex outermembrane receptor protein
MTQKMNKVISLIVLSFFILLHASGQSISPTRPDTLSRIFSLGEVSVSGKKIQPIFNAVGSEQLRSFARNDVAQALNLLPGVTLSEVGPRNEAMLYLRGFDLRQVPVLFDGIPVYVPYDGYVDLARFTTFDLSEIRISKDYTSVNYGPNAMGGAINLITRRPVNRFELGGATGWQSGGYRSNFNVGSNEGKSYIQAGISKYKRNYFPLSKNFTATRTENGGHRENSYSDDEKVSFRIAYTPSAKSEYAISYAYQHGTKGTPVYTGTDTLNSLLKKPRYWQWPKWDKQSIYFLSDTRFDSTRYLKTRIYFDQFINTLNSYDDDAYSTMTRPYAFSSLYNDYTTGAILEYGKKFGTRDEIVSSAQYKQDVHREHNVGEPVRRMSDATTTIAVENRLSLTSQLTLHTGVSFNNRSSLTAQYYHSDTKQISDYPSNRNNAVNLQGSLQYAVNTNHVVSLSVARKTRFATTKDRYSYRMGTALPNPDLKAEYTLNYDLSYHGNLMDNTLNLYAAAFYSKISNTILSVDNVAYDSSTQTYLTQLQNVGKSEYMGFELGVNYHISPTLVAGTNYTYIKRNNLSRPGIYFTDVPRGKLFGFVQYRFKDIFTVEINGEQDSKRYSTSYGTVADGFSLFNTRGEVHLWRWFSVEAGVNNILDKNYALTEGYPEPGRNYFVNLVYRIR